MSDVKPKAPVAPVTPVASAAPVAPVAPAAQKAPVTPQVPAASKDKPVVKQNASPKDEGKVDVETTKKTVNILICATDLTFAKSIQTIYNGIMPPGGENPCRIFPGTTKDKIVESLSKFKFHSVIVDEDFIQDTTLEKWRLEFSELLKKYENNVGIPTILTMMKVDPPRVRELIRAGWKDILVKPLDSALFMQKMHLYNPKQEILKEPLLFTMDADKVVDLAFTYKVKSISEYGLRIEASRELEQGLVLAIHASFFAQQMSGVVLNSKKANDGTFAVEVMFVGITPAETQMIRKFIRQEYAEEKQAG